MKKLTLFSTCNLPEEPSCPCQEQGAEGNRVKGGQALPHDLSRSLPSLQCRLLGSLYTGKVNKTLE